MKFGELDERMRLFETSHDHCVLPGLYMVARLDGRSFTRLTKHVREFNAPFDERFRDLMVQTTTHLMCAGFRVVYGYTQSDEVSLLLDRRETTFGRKLRKVNSVLAGEASAKFSTLLGDPACFDCRVSQLPTADFVVDYFRWRSRDARRNALNAHCYWTLRAAGMSARAATHRLNGLGVAAKNELLFERGVNFNDLPAWQRRGVGAWWETYQKVGRDPRTGRATVAERRRLRVELELPVKGDYDELIRTRCEECED